MKADVAVIVVTWNSRADLERLLPSVHEGARSASIQLIVVDNASTDGSAALVEARYPEARIIRNAHNAGFAAANNQAMLVADARYVMLLNPDTVVMPGAIDVLVGFLDAREHVWVAGPALLNSDGTEQRSGVRFPAVWNILVEALFLDRLFPSTRLFGAHRELYLDSTRPRPVDYVQGSCMAVRSRAITVTGTLDEGYFMYFEETDWCRRIKQAGGEVWICPDARVVHFGGEGPGHYDERRVKYYHAGLLRYFRKHTNSATRIALRVVVMLRTLLRMAVWALVLAARPRLRGAALSSLRGYAALPRMLIREPL